MCRELIHGLIGIVKEKVGLSRGAYMQGAYKGRKTVPFCYCLTRFFIGIF